MDSGGSRYHRIEMVNIKKGKYVPLQRPGIISVRLLFLQCTNVHSLLQYISCPVIARGREIAESIQHTVCLREVDKRY